MNITKFLKENTTIFKNFSEQALNKLAKQSQQITFEPNEAVIEFGEDGRFLGIMIEGEAEVSISDDRGERTRIAVLKPGDIFGEMSLMTGDKTIADVIGITRCKALLIRQNIFSASIITQPSAIMEISRLIKDRFQNVSYDEKSKLANSALEKSKDPYGFKLKSTEPMNLLIINCTANQLKYNLFNTFNETKNSAGIISGIGSKNSEHFYTYGTKQYKTKEEITDLAHALTVMLKQLTDKDKGVIENAEAISAVGHRVVHGGDIFKNTVIINQDVLQKLKKVSYLAPLHNPVNITGIKQAMKLLPTIPHVAVFDTSFHHTLPPYAYLYGLPYEYYEKKGIKRYGFHGMSHSYAALKAAEFLKKPYNSLEIATCHMGNGSSMCAVDHGRSVDTTMGLTPAEGLIMSTRSGNFDPQIIINLMRQEKMGPDELEELINKKSGLLGLSGISSDMLKIEKEANKGNHRALLAFKTYCYQIRKTIGAYMAAMGGLDVLVFTGGIGYGSSGARSLACQGLECMGVLIDEKINRNNKKKEPVFEISRKDSPVKVLVIKSNEELMIARETIHALKRDSISSIIKSQEPMPVPIEVSAHHIHLSKEHLAQLFGQGHELTPVYELSQPGQFACKEKVNLIGPKGRVDRVRVLGPTRKNTQVEIAMTEQFKLGVEPPIRQSGDIEGSPGVSIEGPKATIKVDKGVICAMRHIHMSPQEAMQYGLHDKDVVRVRIAGDRELIYGDVLVRVHPNYRLAMHIDTDEANAANIHTGMKGYIDAIQSRA